MPDAIRRGRRTYPIRIERLDSLARLSFRMNAIHAVIAFVFLAVFGIYLATLWPALLTDRLLTREGLAQTLESDRGSGLLVTAAVVGLLTLWWALGAAAFASVFVRSHSVELSESTLILPALICSPFQKRVFPRSLVTFLQDRGTAVEFMAEGRFVRVGTELSDENRLALVAFLLGEEPHFGDTGWRRVDKSLTDSAN